MDLDVNSKGHLNGETKNTTIYSKTTQIYYLLDNIF